MKTEQISNAFLTNIGGFSALIVVFITTLCNSSASAFIDLCRNENYPFLVITIQR